MTEITKRAPVRLDQLSGKLVSDRFIHSVELSDPIVRVESGCTILPYDFRGENKDVCNGCEFVLNPEGGHTNVVRLIKPGVVVEEVPSSGSGFLLMETSKGEVEAYYFLNDDLRSKTFEFVMTPTDTKASVWIANRRIARRGTPPFRVINLTRPPYDDGTEEEIVVDSPSVSVEFWQQYHRLISEGRLDHGAFTLLPE